MKNRLVKVTELKKIANILWQEGWYSASMHIENGTTSLPINTLKELRTYLEIHIGPGEWVNKIWQDAGFSLDIEE